MSDLSPCEHPAPPWRHLVRRDHPWRRQLYARGRNMTVRQLVGKVLANRQTPEQAAEDLDLPVEAVVEAIRYAEECADVIARDQEEERRA